jgi:hypothetical protein
VLTDKGKALLGPLQQLAEALTQATGEAYLLMNMHVLRLMDEGKW